MGNQYRQHVLCNKRQKGGFLENGIS